MAVQKSDAARRLAVYRIKGLLRQRLDRLLGGGQAAKAEAVLDITHSRVRRAVGEGRGDSRAVEDAFAQELEGRAKWVAGEMRQGVERFGKRTNRAITRFSDALELLLRPEQRPPARRT